MKRLTTLTTILAFAVAGALLLVVGFAAPKTDATTSLCHATTLSIKAPTTAKAGTTVKVTGTEAKAPAHTVKATLQWRRAGATRWKNGATANLTNGAYSLKWKAPAKKAKYKVRVRLTHSGASHASAVKTIKVK